MHGNKSHTKQWFKCLIGSALCQRIYIILNDDGNRVKCARKIDKLIYFKNAASALTDVSNSSEAF